MQLFEQKWKGYLKSGKLFEQEYDQEAWKDIISKGADQEEIANYLANIGSKYIEFDDSIDVEVEESDQDVLDREETGLQNYLQKQYYWYYLDAVDKFVDKYGDKDGLYFTLLDPRKSNFGEYFFKKYFDISDNPYDYEYEVNQYMKDWGSMHLIFSDGSYIPVNDKVDVEMIKGAGQI